MTDLICPCGWVGKPNPHSDPPTCPGCGETGTLQEESVDLEALAEALAAGDAAFTSEHGYSFLDQWLPTGDGREDVIKFVEAFTDYKVQRRISQRETGND